MSTEVIIDEITFKAGETKDPVINEEFNLLKIPHRYANQHQDVIVHFHLGTDLTLHHIAIEFKHKDLHQSLMGKGVGGILIWELQQYYLPQRTRKEFDEVWLFLVLDDSITIKDKMILESKLFEHRVPCKLFGSTKSAVKNIIEEVKKWGQRIDLSHAVYIADQDVSHLNCSLRTWDGFTDARLEELGSMWYIYQIWTLGVKQDIDLLPLSWYGIVEMVKRWGKEIEKREAFWYKWIDFVMNGVNNIPITKRDKTPQLKQLQKEWKK